VAGVQDDFAAGEPLQQRDRVRVQLRVRDLRLVVANEIREQVERSFIERAMARPAARENA
jgi:hypothetical protein